MRLEPIAVADADELVEVLAADEIYRVIGGTAPTLDELRRRLTAWSVGGPADRSERWLNWTIRTTQGDGQIVGTAQATLEWSPRIADVAWIVAPFAQRRGFAAAAATAVVQWLHPQHCDVVTAHIAPGHTASEGVARKAGLKPTGTFDDDGEQVWSTAEPLDG